MSEKSVLVIKRSDFQAKKFLQCLNLPKIDVEIALFTFDFLKNAIF